MLKELIFAHQKNRNNQMKDLSKLSGNEMKFSSRKGTEYRGYKITTGGLGYEYVHKDYEGVFEYDGETGAPSQYDRRSGSARTIEQCREEIDELEIDNPNPDRNDDDFESGLENERQNS